MRRHHIKSIGHELLRRFEELEKEVEKHKRTAICMYCGTVQQTKDGQEKLTMIIEHMAVCEKHPIPILLSKVEVLEKELESWRNSRDGVMADIEALALKVINLVCCGNCLYFSQSSGTFICGLAYTGRLPCKYCKDWQSDGLSREEREGK